MYSVYKINNIASLWYLQIDILFILEAKYTRKIGTQWELIFIFSFHSGFVNISK